MLTPVWLLRQVHLQPILLFTSVTFPQFNVAFLKMLCSYLALFLPDSRVYLIHHVTEFTTKVFTFLTMKNA